MTLLENITRALNRRTSDLAELRDLDLEARDEMQRLTNDRTVLARILEDPATTQAAAAPLGRRVDQIGAEIARLLRARAMLADRERLLVRNRGSRARREVLSEIDEIAQRRVAPTAR